MFSEREISRRYADGSNDNPDSGVFTIEDVFLCPVSRKGCSFCFPPYCIYHRDFLNKVTECSHATQRSLHEYSALVKLLDYNEMLKELRNISYDLACLPPNVSKSAMIKRIYHHCGNVHNIEAEARERWATLPVELRLLIEQVAEQKTFLIENAGGGSEESSRREEVII